MTTDARLAALLPQLLDAADEMLMLVDAADMSILAVNQALLGHLGYRREELLGTPVGNLECALSDMFFWDEMGGKAAVSDVEGAYRCADGSVLEVTKSVKRVGGPEPCDQVYAVSAQSTERQQRIEAELATMGSRLRATLEATADGITLVDRAGTIISMNRRFAEMWAIPERLLVNRDDAGIIAHMRSLRRPSPSRPEGAVPPSPTLSGDAEGDTFDTLYLLDGRVIERASHPAREKEQIIGRVFSYHDVTERYRNQQELILARDEAKRASRAKGDFLAMMSHEIRTPMNGVLGIAELLAGTALDDDQADYVRVIRSSGETLLSILNDILDYSKIEAGKLTLERTDFALVPLLEEITALFRFRLRDDGPSFTCTADGSLPPVLQGDPVRLRQVLFNLVGNAFKFTERGRIDVTVRAADSSAGERGNGKMTLRFAVRDTGIGLTSEQAARMFQSFEQADSSTTRKYGGTGLGLAICKRLAELMEGEIGVSSVANEGSEFWFTAQLGIAAAKVDAVLPQTIPGGTQKVPASDPKVVQRKHSSGGGDALTQVPLGDTAMDVAALPLTPELRILLVEDNLINRKVMSGMLKRLGAGEPVVAGDGQEAVELATREVFDLILMDTQMPVMDGLEATRRLRAAGRTLPIIGVSAGALEEERQAALDAGVDDYLLKPVNLHALGTVIARALAMAKEISP